MIKLPFLKDQSVAVIGLGKSGHSVVDALEESGAKVLTWDDKNPPQGIEHPSEWDWSKIDLMVLSPGVPYTHPEPHDAVKLAQQHGVEIVGEVELLFRAQPDATCIAITGTNGKSTTTSLIAHILEQAGRKVQVGGNLDIPSLALEPLGKDGIYVLELSSYQCDLLRTTKFDVSILLNLSPDHLDRHGDMDGYIAAKDHIFDRMDGDDVMIIGVDDAHSEAVARFKISQGRSKVIPITTTQTSDNAVWVKDAVLHNPLISVPPPAYGGRLGGGQTEKALTPTLSQGEREMKVLLTDMKNLQGVHNHQNAAAAYAACWSVGVSHDDIVAGMESFGGLAHRMQRVGMKGDVIFVNDSKATNADAAEKSLATFDDIYWIAGGVAKDGGIESLAPYFPKIKQAFLIGQAQDEFAKTLEGNVAYERCESLDVATAKACAVASSGVVLLAPACASFDQFPNFEVRGNAFVAAVEDYLSSEVKNAV